MEVHVNEWYFRKWWSIENCRKFIKELDFLYRKDAESMCCARFGQGTGPILLDDVDCLGTEYDIGHCKHKGWGMHNCGHQEDVSIRCSRTGIALVKNNQMKILKN